MLLPIILHPDPRLRAPCAGVTSFDDGLRTLAADMTETMYAAPGLGLAAPQVGRALRLFVFDPWHLDDADGTRRPLVLANPEIVRSVGTQRLEEGCLSLPGIYEVIERAGSVVVRAQDGHGVPFERSFDGLAAFALQHELDHLDGILLIDRIVAKLRGRR